MSVNNYNMSVNNYTFFFPVGADGSFFKFTFYVRLLANIEIIDFISFL